MSKSNKVKKHIPTGIEAEVCKDIADRQALGIAKYGTTVADNPLTLKQWLSHAYEETLDKAVYLKRAISEVDKVMALGKETLTLPMLTSGQAVHSANLILQLERDCYPKKRKKKYKSYKNTSC